MTTNLSQFLEIKSKVDGNFKAKADNLIRLCCDTCSAESSSYLRVSGEDIILFSQFEKRKGPIQSEELLNTIMGVIRHEILVKSAQTYNNSASITGLSREVAEGAYMTVQPVILEKGVIGILLIIRNTEILDNEAGEWLNLVRCELQSLEYTEQLSKYNDLLQKQLAQKDQFYSVIAHDLKSPFNGFLGLTYLLSEELDNIESDEIKEIILTLRKSANNMFMLLDHFLEWSRILRGVIHSDPRPLGVRPILDRILQNLFDIIEQKQIRIIDKITEETFLFCDPAFIYSILRHIILNSVKFSNIGGVVEISTLSRNDHVLFTIRDEGTGITPEIEANLFDPNILVKKQGTDGESGAGLGLIICRWYVEQSGGKFWLDTLPGKGTSVLFTLPVNP